MKQIITLLTYCLIINYSFAQQGTLDNSFGKQGKIVTDGTYDACYAISLQNDGKIIAAGQGEYEANLGFLLIRYNSNGNLDASFGKGGKVVTVFASSYAPIYAVHLQADGKIVAAGVVPGDGVDVGLVRYNPNGDIDSSFGINGIVSTSLEKYDYVTDMNLQPDGKIVVTGNIIDDNNNRVAFFIIRYIPDGSLDNSFGNQGILITTPDEAVEINSLALQPDGKILIAGNYIFKNDFLVIRYMPDGKVDPIFGINGQAVIDFESSISTRGLKKITLQQDGKILALGIMGVLNAYRLDITLIRLEGDGKTDVSFGKNGIAKPDFGERKAIAGDILIQTNGKIVVAGSVYDLYNYTNGDFAIARYLANGQPDSTFGDKGLQTTDIEGNANVNAAALQPDGKIVIAGATYIETPPSNHFALARYNGEEIEKNKYVKIKRWLHHHGFTWEYKPDNLKYYSVQRSSDGSAFNEIAKIFNRGNAAQQFEDTSPASGTSYYRVAAVSANNVTSYSNIIAIENSNVQIKIYPNPAKNVLQVAGLPATEKTKLSIADINGTTRMATVANSNLFSWNIGQLPKGNYVLNIQQGNTKVSKKFIKE